MAQPATAGALTTDKNISGEENFAKKQN